jgi:hypothetical protein
MNFWKSFFAAFLALILFTVISFILLIGVIGGITAEDEVIVADNSVGGIAFLK